MTLMMVFWVALVGVAIWAAVRFVGRGSASAPTATPTPRAILDHRLACERAPGEGADYGGGGHTRWRRHAPTSPTLRDLICSPAQRWSRDEMAIPQFPPG